MGGKKKEGQKQIDVYSRQQIISESSKESILKIELLVLLLFGFDANLGVELVWNICLCLVIKNAWGGSGTDCSKQSAAIDMLDDRKQTV